MQPNLATLSHAILRWYVNKARQTKQDWFVLPPSGALNAYPSQFPDELQSKYVQMTNAAAGILNTSGSADWEFLGMWHSAMEHYFPQIPARARWCEIIHVGSGSLQAPFADDGI